MLGDCGYDGVVPGKAVVAGWQGGGGSFEVGVFEVAARSLASPLSLPSEEGIELLGGHRK